MSSNLLEEICATFLNLKPTVDYEFNPKDVDKGEYFNIINKAIKKKKFLTPLTMILGYIFDKLFTLRHKQMKKS